MNLLEAHTLLHMMIEVNKISKKTMTLTLGALAEGGESYYAMLDDDPIIYLIPSNEIGSLFSMTVDNLTAVEETEEETDAESGTETETDTQSDTTTD